MKIIFIFLVFIVLNFSSSFAANNNFSHDFILTKFLSDTEIEIMPIDPLNGALLGDLLVILSHESKEAIGYAAVKKIESQKWIATVKMHSKEALVRPGNFLQKVDLTNYHTKIPARFDLVRKNQKEVASKFKPLVFLDYQLGQAAATLDKKESLLGPSIYAYGINNNFQTDSTLLLNLVGIPNIGLKYTVLTGEDYRLSLYTKYYHYLERNKNSYDFEALLDKTANTHMITFTKVTHKVKRPDRKAVLTSRIYDEGANTEIQTIYGYILGNWNRLLLGPKYNFEQKILGGAAIYTAIYNHFHWSITLQTVNLSKIKLGKEAYNYYADFYWRF